MPTELFKLRRKANKIFQAGIAAADPYQAVKRHLKVVNNCLEIALNDNPKNKTRTANWKKIHLLAFGKAAVAMAKAAKDSIPEELLAKPAIVITNYENATPIPGLKVIAASHPLPDQAGFNAAKMLAEQARSAKQDELVLVLISGGGSALAPYPVTTISLADKIATTALLLSCGADINQINCARKHLSEIKGGGLARMAAPADVHALILSDVLGDDLSSIASGPTVPDNTTFQDAVMLLKAKHIWQQVPQSVQIFLTQAALGDFPETPNSDDPLFQNTGHTLLGSNFISVKAIMQAANDQGYNSRLYKKAVCGEARNEAEKLAAYVHSLVKQKIAQPIALLAGGETTVTLKGNGLGGRNQEMALAFVLAAEKYQLDVCWTFLSGGTDGRDGPTDAAGGLVDSDSFKRMLTAGIDPYSLLENNDSYNALKSSQDLLETGATGTNVADLQILLIHPIT